MCVCVCAWKLFGEANNKAIISAFSKCRMVYKQICSKRIGKRCSVDRKEKPTIENDDDNNNNSDDNKK